MKKEELMYGNKLLFLNEVVTFSNISQIREDGIFWIKTIEPKIDSKSFHFKPIPITEEWLLKFNGKFKYISHRTECFFNSCYFEIYLYKNQITLIYTGGEGVQLSNPIRYLHQLQNLYFALTGTHLKLK